MPGHKRFCGHCDQPVGRGRDGRPGRVEGFCRSCGRRYSFVPTLRVGELVGGQYRVAGCLAHGGLGWIYLATDENVSNRWVVLKGLIDSGSAAALAASHQERKSLAEVEHPNIVKIFNFVDHGGAGYIVMEYVGGSSLRATLEGRRALAGKPAPLPLAQALAYLIEILPAFGYLHEHGLLYCDFKPDNVIQTGQRLTLIDLGAVVHAGEEVESIYGTVGYQAPEIAELGPSVGSDLYTVGRTLAVLSFDFRGYQTRYATSLPDRESVDCLAGCESYYRLLARATAANPADRFASADEMAEQMLGVLREVLAADGDPRPAPSPRFGADRGCDAGAAAPDWRDLPEPLVNPGDPAAAFLNSITEPGPDRQLGLLAQAPQRTIEVELRIVAALLAIFNGDPAAVRAQLAVIERAHSAATTAAPATTGDGVSGQVAGQGAAQAVDWRHTWFGGVLALAEGRLADADAAFEALFSALPGELAVKLALAVTRELAGRPGDAAGYYDVVCRTDPAYVSACAGLARCRLTLADSAGAVEALGRVSPTSSAYRSARLTAIRALLGPVRARSSLPPAADLDRAATLLATLDASPVERAGLRADLLAAGLALMAAGQPVPPGIARSLGGAAPSERAVRSELEGCYRILARAADGPQRVRLVDQANTVRPRTWTPSRTPQPWTEPTEAGGATEPTEAGGAAEPGHGPARRPLPRRRPRPTSRWWRRARAWLGPRSRGRAGAGVATRSGTPVLLRRRLVALVAGSLLAVLLAGAALLGRLHSAGDVRARISPAVLTALEARAALSDADRTAWQSFRSGAAALVGPGQAYGNDLTTVGQDLARLAQLDPSGSLGSQRLQTVEGQLVAYQGLVEQADAAYRSSLVAGTASHQQLGLAFLTYSSSLLHSSGGLLAQLDQIGAGDQQALDGQRAVRWTQPLLLIAPAAVAVALGAGLVGTQLFVSHRFRVAVAPPLVVATAALVGLAVWTALVSVPADHSYRSAQHDTLPRLVAQWRSQASGADAASAALRAEPTGSTAGSGALDLTATQPLRVRLDGQLSAATATGGLLVGLPAGLAVIAAGVLFGLLPRLGEYRR